MYVHSSSENKVVCVHSGSVCSGGSMYTVAGGFLHLAVL